MCLLITKLEYFMIMNIAVEVWSVTRVSPRSRRMDLHNYHKIYANILSNYLGTWVPTTQKLTTIPKPK